MTPKTQPKPNIYGTGLIALDLVVSAYPNQPIQNWAGGTCGNVLTILSYLGWNSFPIARLNGDPASLRVKDDMHRWGVNLDFAEQPPTASTPIIVQKNSHDKSGYPIHKFSWHCPNCGAWLPNYKAITCSPAKNIATQISNPSVFFFDRVSPASLILAEKCKQLGALIFFEPSGKCDQKKMMQALTLADVVKYSHDRIDSLEQILNGPFNTKLEIKTLGQKGLSFRSRLFGKRKFKWFDLSAPKVEDVVDACGCGDWATAGIISKICNYNGVSSLDDITFDQVTDALHYGQALAAWNCSFEGARGGMYSATRVKFNREIAKIITNGSYTHTTRAKSSIISRHELSICPSCKP